MVFKILLGLLGNGFQIFDVLNPFGYLAKSCETYLDA